MDESKIRDLNLSTAEISRLEKAFCDQKFKDLFAEYLSELQDPENQKVFENEIAELERQRGNNILFIKPTPHYLLKTSNLNNNAKAYINILSDVNVNKVNYAPAQQQSICGVNVSIPYSLSPEQRTCGKRIDESFNVYSIVFHPDTLQDAENNDGLRKALEETVFSAIEKSFQVNLDKVNFKAAKKSSYKGSLETTIVRKKSDNAVAIVDQPIKLDDYIEPTHKIIYCNEVDLQNSTTDKYSKLNILIPNQMKIEIHLPLLTSIQDTKLDVKPTSIELSNEHPKYRLYLALPYRVNEEAGSAKFNPDTHTLTLELTTVKNKMNKPVDPDPLITEVELEPSSTCKHQESKPSSDLTFVTKSDENFFLNPTIKYKLPDYCCNYLQNRLAFTLKVKNVVKNSFEYKIHEKGDGFRLKFTSLGNGHFSMYYSMYVSFVDNIVEMKKALDYLLEDETMFVYVHLKEGCRPLEYFLGLDENNTEKRFLNEVEAIELEVKDKKPQKLDINLEVTEVNKQRVVINVKAKNKKDPKTSPPTKQNGTLSNGTVKPETPLEKQTPAKARFNVTAAKEELLFDTHNYNEVPIKGKICDKLRTQFSMDEELHSLSESETISVPRLNGSSPDNHKGANSDTENGSWVVTSKSSKKTKRKKKARNHMDEKIICAPEDVQESDTVAAECDVASGVCNAISQPIDIKSAYIYSDMSSRGILKKGRSYSESSGDELCLIECSRSYSVDEVTFSSDSCAKKSVTFNDVISKKLYSSDISILEQRKRTKRRSQRKERRASDSENSETDSAAGDKREQNIHLHNEILFLESSENELTSLSESCGETSDDQSDNPDAPDAAINRQPVPCSKKNHKRRGKKSARKNASTAKHHYGVD